MGLSDLDPEDVEEGEGQDDNKPIVVDSESSSTPEAGSSLIQPADDIEDIAAHYEKFEEIKESLLKESDVQEISGNGFITKSGWRKIATAFNVSVETVETEGSVEGGVVHIKVKAVAEAPNGKTASGIGVCSSNESNFMEAGKPDDGSKPQEHPDYMKVDGKWRRLKRPREVNRHNLETTAATRAKNRAISDCVGGGEVSAEEISGKSKDDVL